MLGGGSVGLYGLFGWFSVVCCVNGGGSLCFVGFVVVVLMYLKK